MTEQRGVIVTHNAHDYAVAISLHRKIARSAGIAGCYPIQVPIKESVTLGRIFAHYGLRVLKIEELSSKSDVLDRSRALAQRFDPGGGVLELPIEATPDTIANAIGTCLEHELTLIWVRSESAVRSVFPTEPRGNRQHPLFVRAGSALAVAAAFYGHLAGKFVRFVPDIQDVLEPGQLDDCTSAMLVDDYAAFNKRLLERVAGWTPGEGFVGSPSILTAYSPVAFSGLVWRMLEHAASRKSGGCSRACDPFELLDATVEPVEYAVINEHGNESHMHYGHEVLCGAISEEFRGDIKRPFNCEQSCPHESRVSAAHIPAHHLVILSCNTFTLGDGVVTPEYNLLLNFLNGWPLSIIAPLQHASLSPLSSVFAEAMIESGYNQAEITFRLNHIVQLGSYPEPQYVLLGDPELTIGQPASSTVTTTLPSKGNTLQVSFPTVRRRLVESALPEDWLRTLSEHDLKPTITSLSRAVEPGTYICFYSDRGPTPSGFIVFSDHEWAPGFWTLQLEAKPKATEVQAAAAIRSAAEIRQHRMFGVDPTLISRMEDGVLALVRADTGYPRLFEPLQTEQSIPLDQALSSRVQLIRRALLEDLVRRTADRVWLNHHYASHYSTALRLEDAGSAVCAFCGNPTHTTRHDDPYTGLTPRDMTICTRCGIVGDLPSRSPLEIELQPTAAFEGVDHIQRLLIRNRGEHPVELSYFVQFHSWKKLGVDGVTRIIDVTIPAHSAIENEIPFHFARPLPDYIHDIMCYVLTEDLKLHCIGQRVATGQKGMFVARQDIHAHHDPHHAQAHHVLPHHEQVPAVAATTGAVKNGKAAKRSLVIVEPHAALFRYLHIARQRFRVVVLANRPDKCLQQERYFTRSTGMPTGTQLDRLIQCNTTDVDAMVQALAPWRESVAGILAGDDVFVPISAELGRRFGFDYALKEDAVTQHLKTAMKLRFHKEGVPTPRFIIAGSLDEAKDAWETLGRDSMLKMVDCEASVNIFRVTSVAELEDAWDAIVNNRNQVKMAFTPSREVILEEFVSGRELTVEGYVQNGNVVCLNFCEKITDKFIVVGHLLPALVSAQEAEVLTKAAREAVLAVGMRNTVFHVEIHLQGNTPYVIECAARPPGANMVELMSRSYGFDLMEISIALATGELVTLCATEPMRHFAMLALYSHEDGILERIEGLEQLQRRGGVVHVHLDVKPGDHVEPLAGMHQGDGFVMLEDTNAVAVREKAKWLRNNVGFVLKQDVAAAVAQ